MSSKLSAAAVVTPMSTSATVPASSSSSTTISSVWYDKYITHLERPMYDSILIGTLVVCEAILCYGIILKVPYTEIDFVAYMQQVTTFLRQEERDYYHIRGTTGPLVYPAGFLYIYTIIQYVSGYGDVYIGASEASAASHDDLGHDGNQTQRATGMGMGIRMTQYIFILLYCCTQLFVFLIYYKSTIQLIQQQKQQLHHSSLSPPKPKPQQQIWMWRIVLLLLCCSKRMHSIYILRLFNDGITMLFFYMSLYCLLLGQQQQQQQSSARNNHSHQNNNNYNSMINVGCVLFSIAVSIKMNVLLFAPGLLLLLLHISDNLYHCIRRIILYCGVPQLLLGAPFLLRHPIHYVHKAFEFDRTFFYLWTVNWKFLPEDIFVSKPLSIALLLCHISSLIYFCYQWVQSISSNNNSTTPQQQHQPRRRIFFINSPDHDNNNNNDTSIKEVPKQLRLSPIYITSTMFTCNFIGIVFARTLHYQFYSWYYHAIPFLLFCNDIYNNLPPDSTATTTQQRTVPRLLASYPILIRLGIILCIELSFLTFPATPYSSFMLQISHLLILVQIRPPPYHLFLLNNDDMAADKKEQINKID